MNAVVHRESCDEALGKTSQLWLPFQGGTLTGIRFLKQNRDLINLLGLQFYLITYSPTLCHQNTPSLENFNDKLP